MLKRKTSLTANIVAFCRHLRLKKFVIGPGEEIEVLSAIEILDAVSDPDIFRETLKTVLAKSRKERLQFNKLYNAYWKELAKGVDAKIKESNEPPETQRPAPRKRPPSLIELKSWLYGNRSEEEAEIALYSPGEVLNHKDFSAFPRKGIEEIIRVIYAFAKTLATKHNRRYRSSRSPGIFDLRRTMRKNMRQGGEIINLAYRKPKQKRLKVVLLCDVSRSMDLYSRFMIQFMYAFQCAYRNIETFIFSTSLQRITKQLDQKDFDVVLEKMSEEVDKWSGGTQIGSSLKIFTDFYATKMLDHRTVVIILSDGLDSGEITTLQNSLSTIKRRSASLIWLNPLAGRPGYRPEVKGMKAALPFIDFFAGVHDAETLKTALKGFKAKRTGNHLMTYG